MYTTYAALTTAKTKTTFGWGLAGGNGGEGGFSVARVCIMLSSLSCAHGPQKIGELQYTEVRVAKQC